MLNPFKSFLNNLQKNAEQLFGTKGNTSDMNINPDEEEEIAADSIYNIEELESLDDPLALDEEYAAQPFENSGSVYESTNTTLSELDSSDDGRIILVDVNSLKSSYSEPTSYVKKRAQKKAATATVSSKEANSERDNGQASSSSKKYTSISLALRHEVTDEVEGVRSDGSDSGLGVEISSQQISNKPSTSTRDSPNPSKSNLKRRSNDEIDIGEAKKPKRNIQFTDVTVFYFPRIQGFTCVPSQGGCTLGMATDHCEEKSFSLSEHTAEQKRIHRLQMLERSPTPSTSLNTSPLQTLLPNGPPLQTANEIAQPSAGDDRSRSSTEESDTDEENISDNSGSELDTESIGFLQPVSQKQRRALLKSAGVRDIASFEKNECRDIRASRELCGCRCRDYCDPESCFCSRSGIKCQVDRPNFPCGCTENGCGNVHGRVEFNPKRVRTHFIHTIMRLELEKKQKKSDKQNTLHTYDGRLRIPENGGDSTDSANIDQTHKVNQLVIYNPANNILYPPSTLQPNAVMHSTNHRHISTASHIQFDDTSQNTAVTAGSPIDLHYAYRNDYSLDIPSTESAPTNYPMLYGNTNYYRNACGPGYDDFISLNPSASSSSSSPSQHPTIMSYTNYGTITNNAFVLSDNQIANTNGVASNINNVETNSLHSNLPHTNGTYYGKQLANELYISHGASSMIPSDITENNKIDSQRFGATNVFSAEVDKLLSCTAAELVPSTENNTKI